jgi:transposase
MTTKRIHYPRTTGQQRKRLFEIWAETGNISEACRKAHVGRGTFYYWQRRFEQQGYEGLENFESHAPEEPVRTPEDVAGEVIALKKKHPAWGKKRIAHELAKNNNWVPVISPNSVKRVLKDAGLWKKVEEAAKKKQIRSAAEQPNSLDRASM